MAAGHCLSGGPLAHAPDRRTARSTDIANKRQPSPAKVNDGHPLPAVARRCPPAHSHPTVHTPTRRQTPGARRRPSPPAEDRQRPPKLADDLRGPPTRPPAHVRFFMQAYACILPPACFSVSYFKTPEVLNVSRAQSRKKQSLRRTLCALFSYARCR